MARVLFILTKNYMASKGRKEMAPATRAEGSGSDSGRLAPTDGGAPAPDEGCSWRGSAAKKKLPFGLDCLAGGDCCRRRTAQDASKSGPPVLMNRAATITVATDDGSEGTIHVWKKAKRRGGARRRSSLRTLLVGCAVALAALLLLLLVMKVSPWSTALIHSPLPPPSEEVEGRAENESSDALVLEAFAQLREQILDVRSIVRRLEDLKDLKGKGGGGAGECPRASSSPAECEDGRAAALIAVQRPTTDALNALTALRWEVMNVRRALWRLQRRGGVLQQQQCRGPSSMPPPPPSSSLEEGQWPDFAAEAAGGAIVATPRTRAFVWDEWETLWGIPVWRVRRSPRLLIQSPASAQQPGACWAFQGAEGRVVVALAEPARVAAVALEHVTAVVAGTRQSAPRAFEVTGLMLTTDAYGVPLGRFQYDLQGPSAQTFPVKDPPRMKFRAVLLHILNNHGNPQYTCVYRFRVHGFTDAAGQQGYVP